MTSFLYPTENQEKTFTFDSTYPLCPRRLLSRHISRLTCEGGATGNLRGKRADRSPDGVFCFANEKAIIGYRGCIVLYYAMA